MSCVITSPWLARARVVFPDPVSLRRYLGRRGGLLLWPPFGTGCHVAAPVSRCLVGGCSSPGSWVPNTGDFCQLRDLVSHLCRRLCRLIPAQEDWQLYTGTGAVTGWAQGLWSSTPLRAGQPHSQGQPAFHTAVPPRFHLHLHRERNRLSYMVSSNGLGPPHCWDRARPSAARRSCYWVSCT